MAELQSNTLRLVRDDCGDEGCFGTLYIPEERLDGHVIWHKIQTAERPWRSNKPNVSCYPAGTWKLRARDDGNYYRKYKREFSHAFVVAVEGVPARGGLLFHVGNFPLKNSRGCTLLGNRRGHKGNKRQTKMIFDSKPAYKRFYTLIAPLFAKHQALYLEASVKDQPDAQRLA